MCIYCEVIAHVNDLPKDFRNRPDYDAPSQLLMDKVLPYAKPEKCSEYFLGIFKETSTNLDNEPASVLDEDSLADMVLLSIAYCYSVGVMPTNPIFLRHLVEMLSVAFLLGERNAKTTVPDIFEDGFDGAKFNFNDGEPDAV